MENKVEGLTTTQHNSITTIQHEQQNADSVGMMKPNEVNN